MGANRICDILSIKYPIIQGGMVWVSGAKLVSAVSNSGGLGLLGAGSMTTELLEQHIIKCNKLTDNPFGVNIPLLYSKTDDMIKIIIKQNVKIVFTSAGSPSKWTKILKDEGIKVVHVVSSLKFALKAQDAGVDAIVGEGFEAGGHNGREETTTMCLIPMLKEKIEIPIIAAGGIATGGAMLASMALGAEGVQIGSRFVNTVESSAHESFKKKIIESKEGETALTLKEITPVRLIKNKFYDEIEDIYRYGKDSDKLRNHLGKGRSKLGIFEGDLEDGEMEIGQISSIIDDILPVSTVFENILKEYRDIRNKICDI